MVVLEMTRKGHVKLVPAMMKQQNEVEVDVRTNISCSWFEVEMYGTLEGKDADVAARLAIHQEYYRYRAKLQYALIENLKDVLPIEAKKLERIEELERKGVENPVISELSVLGDWLTICVYALGSEKTRQAMAQSIDETYRHAVHMMSGSETERMRTTKSVCLDEMWSKIALIEKKKNGTVNNGADAQPTGKKGSGAVSSEVIPMQTMSSVENAMSDAVDISLRLREHIHTACLAAAIDAATNHADENPEILNPLLTSIVATQGRMCSKNTEEYYDVCHALRVRGVGVEKLRRQMHRKRNITRFLLGTSDPFEGVKESSIFTHAPKVYEQVIKIPKADAVWIGILSNRDPSYPHPQQQFPEKQQKIKGFTSRVQNRQKSEADASWICGEICQDHLDAFLLGMSEYLCDDFGLKTIDEPITDPVLYPSDGMLRISWHPEQTHLELVVGEDIYQKQLTPSMVHQLRQIGDFLLQNGKGVVALSPPLPHYILQDPRTTTLQMRAWQWILFLATMTLGVYVSLFRRDETGHVLSKAHETVKTRVVEVIQRRTL